MGGGTNDNTGYANEMRDIGGCEASDGGMRDRGVDEELVGGEGLGALEVLLAARGVEDLLRAGLERGFELRVLLATASYCSWQGECTMGIMSAGSLFRRWASCSLKAMRCVMSMSQ